jgi:hypothetical protein
MIWCIISTFLILLQNGVVMVIARDKEEKSDQKKEDGRRSWRMKRKSICPDCKFSFRMEDNNNKKEMKNKLSKKVDRISFAISILTFLLFNIAFWKFYL